MEATVEQCRHKLFKATFHVIHQAHMYVRAKKRNRELENFQEGKNYKHVNRDVFVNLASGKKVWKQLK